MDRTSILGDTIDYLKDLLQRINTLQKEEPKVGTNNQLSLMTELNPNHQVLVRNSPKVDINFCYIYC